MKREKIYYYFSGIEDEKAGELEGITQLELIVNFIDQVVKRTRTSVTLKVATGYLKFSAMPPLYTLLERKGLAEKTRLEIYTGSLLDAQALEERITRVQFRTELESFTREMLSEGLLTAAADMDRSRETEAAQRSFVREEVFDRAVLELMETLLSGKVHEQGFLDWVERNVSIRLVEGLHAKVVAGYSEGRDLPLFALVGSGNFTLTGMGRTGSRIEFGILAPREALSTIHAFLREVRNREYVYITHENDKEIRERLRKVFDEVRRLRELTSSHALLWVLEDILTRGKFETSVQRGMLRRIIQGTNERLASRRKAGECDLPERVEEYDYQIDAVLEAYQILKNEGGVIIADVVGLGKTFIASLLAMMLDNELIASRFSSMTDLFHSEVYSDDVILVIVPPHLETKWRRDLIATFAPYTVEIVSSGCLQNEKCYETKLRKYIDKGGYVIIDEAHWFRNPDSPTHERLLALTKKKKGVVLLTATPFNNGPRDIYALLRLFKPMNVRSGEHTLEDEYTKMIADYEDLLYAYARAKELSNPTEHLKEVIKKFKREIAEALSRDGEKKSPEEIWNDEEEGILFTDPEEMRRALLRILHETIAPRLRMHLLRFMIRRNRRDIEIFYPDESRKFPEVVPTALTYTLKGKGEHFYEATLHHLLPEEVFQDHDTEYEKMVSTGAEEARARVRKLLEAEKSKEGVPPFLASLYQPLRVYLSSAVLGKEFMEKYGDSLSPSQVFELSSQANIAGFMRMLLAKRLDSSLFAFYSTLKKMIFHYMDDLQEIEKHGRIPIKRFIPEEVEENDADVVDLKEMNDNNEKNGREFLTKERIRRFLDSRSSDGEDSLPSKAITYIISKWDDFVETYIKVLRYELMVLEEMAHMLRNLYGIELSSEEERELVFSEEGEKRERFADLVASKSILRDEKFLGFLHILLVALDRWERGISAKSVIFTEYADTANYLAAALRRIGMDEELRKNIVEKLKELEPEELLISKDGEIEGAIPKPLPEADYDYLIEKYFRPYDKTNNRGGFIKVTSQDGDKGSKLKHIKNFFSVDGGGSNGCASKSRRRDEDEYKNTVLLVSTDILSEGVDLDGASILIDYDIPWNPVRIVQRIGRLNRVGKVPVNIEGTELEPPEGSGRAWTLEVFHLLPTAPAEEAIRMDDRLHYKIELMHTVLGEDAPIAKRSETARVSPALMSRVVLRGERLKEAARRASDKKERSTLDVINTLMKEGLVAEALKMSVLTMEQMKELKELRKSLEAKVGVEREVLRALHLHLKRFGLMVCVPTKQGGEDRGAAAERYVLFRKGPFHFIARMEGNKEPKVWFLTEEGATTPLKRLASMEPGKGIEYRQVEQEMRRMLEKAARRKLSEGVRTARGHKGGKNIKGRARTFEDLKESLDNLRRVLLDKKDKQESQWKEATLVPKLLSELNRFHELVSKMETEELSSGRIRRGFYLLLEKGEEVASFSLTEAGAGKIREYAERLSRQKTVEQMETMLDSQKIKGSKDSGDKEKDFLGSLREFNDALEMRLVVKDRKELLWNHFYENAPVVPMLEFFLTP